MDEPLETPKPGNKGPDAHEKGRGGDGDGDGASTDEGGGTGGDEDDVKDDEDDPDKEERVASRIVANWASLRKKGTTIVADEKVLAGAADLGVEIKQHLTVKSVAEPPTRKAGIKVRVHAHMLMCMHMYACA